MSDLPPASGFHAGGIGPDSQPALRVRELLARQLRSSLRLKLLAGRSGLDEVIRLSRIQRPGLALTGYTDYIRYGRVQILGGSEIGYLSQLPAARRARILNRLAECHVSCFIVTKGRTPPRELVSAAEARGVPLLATPIDSTPFIKSLTAILDDRLALRVDLHAVLMDIFGLGVLVMGESGIGKSECALDLIDRGHRLVADDITTIKRIGDSLIGSPPDLTRYHMELRGLGVINIKDLYGVSATRAAKRVELVINLERWESGKEYDRLGLLEEKYRIIGLDLALIRMPVAPGRNIAILVEVASRNQLLKESGYNAALRFSERIDRLVAGGAVSVKTRRRSGPHRPLPDKSAGED